MGNCIQVCRLVGVVALLPVIVAGCTSTNVTPVAKNAVIVSTSAALACGKQGAQRVAFNQAAVETLRRGFDKFQIVGAQSSSEMHQIGTTPVYANTTVYGHVSGNSLYGSGHTTFSGGDPIYGGSNNQDFVVQMFAANDPASTNAIDARQQLGSDWQKKIARDQLTCF